MTSTLGKSARINQPLPGVKSKVSGVILDVKNSVDGELDHLFDGLSANIEYALFEEMWALDEDDAIRHHFNVMRAFRVNGGEFREEFNCLQNKLWKIFIEQRDEHILNSPRGVVAALITSYRCKNERRHKLLIHEVRERFSLLLGRKLDDHPLCPDVQYLCFWQAIDTLGLSYDERALLMPLFHRFVMESYGKVLVATNQILIAHSPVVKSSAH